MEKEKPKNTKVPGNTDYNGESKPPPCARREVFALSLLFSMARAEGEEEKRGGKVKEGRECEIWHTSEHFENKMNAFFEKKALECSFSNDCARLKKALWWIVQSN